MVSINSLYHLIRGLRPREDVQPGPDQRALLAGHHRYRALHRLDVGQRSASRQGLMWRAVNEDGTLTYSFVEALAAGLRLHRAHARRFHLPARHVPDGLQHLAHRPGAAKPAEYEAAAQIA
ncbi:hypothetical protein ACPA9J_07055 [Pseudomonas aeruginosa]